MKLLKTVLASACLVALTAPTLVNAGGIGVIDMREILATSKSAAKVQESLKSEFKERENALRGMEKTLKEKAEKMQRNSAVMSENEKNKVERELVSLQRDFQRKQEEFREDTQIRQREEMSKFMENVQKKVTEYAKEKDFEIIVHLEAAPYSKEKLNITSDVIAKLD